jgi:hypothetical protein
MYFGAVLVMVCLMFGSAFLDLIPPTSTQPRQLRALIDLMKCIAIHLCAMYMCAA